LIELEEEMAKNKSRLGDIYSERPWTERLSKENKDRLLEMVDPEYRDAVRRQLYPSKEDIEKARSYKIGVNKLFNETDAPMPEADFAKFTPNSEVLLEELIDLPNSTLEKVFSYFGLSWPKGQSKWDMLSGHLSDLDMDGKIPAFTEHLNKLFWE